MDALTHGSETARRRLAVILRTLCGEWTIDEACETLGLGRSRFFAMRSRFLEEATTLLEPRAPGPKPRVETESEREARALEARVRELELDVQMAEIREELATALPHVVKGTAPKKNVKTRRRRSR